MRKLLNTLFVTNPDVYIAVESENILLRQDGDTLARFPLLNLESIISFADPGMSPAALGKCCERGIGVTFLSRHGHYRATVNGAPAGNVLLRKKQVLASEDPAACLTLSRLFIFGKLYNQRWILERYKRQYELRIDTDALSRICRELAELAKDVTEADTVEAVRGIEGYAQVRYFSVMNELILRNTDTFYYNERSRRPPKDPLNALLSFAYSLLASDCKNALTSVGLDPYIGFMHSDRPGRASFALDLMEELRGVIADRFVLSLINRDQMNDKDFDYHASGAVLLKEDSRKAYLKAWQKQKQEEIRHPYLDEKIPWGLVPYTQALLLARYLRGDLDSYPCFLWK